MKSYKKIYNRGNLYFDTYYIKNEITGQYVGILEDHCRRVKSRYFIGWNFGGTFIPNTYQAGQTKMFYDEAEAMKYISNDFIK